jgi:hypothetical protein
VDDLTAVVYELLGFVLSLGGGVLALTRLRARQSFYAGEVYHMTLRSHRRFAAISAIFATGFLVALRWQLIGIPLLAIYTLLFVLYASSFARGFSEEDD